jgi:hypothetical protein
VRFEGGDLGVVALDEGEVGADREPRAGVVEAVADVGASVALVGELLVEWRQVVL